MKSARFMETPLIVNSQGAIAKRFAPNWSLADYGSLIRPTVLTQHKPVEVCINPSTISLRQAAPLHVVSIGMQRLPPNQGLFRLLLVQSIPTLLPSESLTLV